MAAGVIAIRSEEEGRAWVQKARELCEEADGLIKRVAQIVKMVEDTSEGDIVVELVHQADLMLELAKSVCTVVQKVCNTIDDVIGIVRAFIDDTTDKLRRI